MERVVRKIVNNEGMNREVIEEVRSWGLESW